MWFFIKKEKNENFFLYVNEIKYEDNNKRIEEFNSFC